MSLTDRQLARNNRTKASHSRTARQALTAVSPRGLFDDVQPENARLMLLAAVSAFARHGYHATTTREIANILGLSPAAVYSHFPTKADLLYEASLRANEDARNLLEKVITQAGGPIATIAVIVRASVLWHAEERIDIKGATIALLRMVDIAPWYSDKGPMSADQLADIYVDLILHMLGAEQADITPTRSSRPES